MQLLPPEDDAELSDGERRLRGFLGLAYRFMAAIFTASHIFDFLFNSNELRSLNQRVEIDLSDKSAGAIVEHQLSKVGEKERLFHAAAFTFAVYILLKCSGFSRNRSVWDLFRLSLRVGVIVAFVRTTQMQQRLYPALHEAFYAYFAFFFVALVLALHPLERLPAPLKTSLQEKEGSGVVEEVSSDEKKEVETEEEEEEFQLIELAEAEKVKSE